MTRMASLTAIAILLTAGSAAAQYNRAAGRSAPMAVEEVEVVDEETGRREKRKVERKPQSDKFGNAQGTQFDLAVDGAFKGQTVAVLQFYPFDFSQARAALTQKGFGVYRWNNNAPSPKELREKLKKACQLWIIATDFVLGNGFLAASVPNALFLLLSVWLASTREARTHSVGVALGWLVFVVPAILRGAGVLG